MDKRLDLLQRLAGDVRRIEQSQAQIVDHINNWVAKIQGIDTVAFAALALHDGKKFTLNKGQVDKAQKEIKAVIDEMGRYRDEAMAEAAKAEKNKTKSPPAPIVKTSKRVKNAGNKILTQ